MIVAIPIIGSLQGIGTLLVGVGTLLGVLRVRATQRQVVETQKEVVENQRPRNGRTLAQTIEMLSDNVHSHHEEAQRDARRARLELAAVARTLGQHLRQSDLDREQLGLLPAEEREPD